VPPAFEAELAGVAKHGLAVAFHVLVEPNVRSGLGEDHFERGLATLKGTTLLLELLELAQAEGRAA
jgi:hypothetical protein